VPLKNIQKVSFTQATFASVKKQERGCDESATTLLDRPLFDVNSADGNAASTPPETLREACCLRRARQPVKLPTSLSNNAVSTPVIRLFFRKTRIARRAHFCWRSAPIFIASAWLISRVRVALLGKVRVNVRREADLQAVEKQSQSDLPLVRATFNWRLHSGHIE
jgi:hypothetical protein